MAPINDNDVKLMLAIIGSTENIKTDNGKLANIIGDGTTANAIRQRVQKIKNQAKALLAGEESDIAFAGSKSSPKSAKKRTNATSQDDEEEEEEASPTKQRAPTGNAKGTPKARGNTKFNGNVRYEKVQETNYGSESPTKRFKTEEADLGAKDEESMGV